MQSHHQQLGSARRQGGYTLIEAMLVLAVLGVLLVMAIPNFMNMMEKRRVLAAAEAIYSDLRWARSESIKRNIEVRIRFNEGSNWSYTINADPTGANTPLKTVNGSDYPRTSIRVTFDHDYTTFSPRRGTARNGSAWLSSSHYSARVSLSTLGRTRICGIGGYDPC